MWKVFKYQVKSQLATSRNLRERWTKKLMRAFWSVVYLLKGFLRAFSFVPRECLGSEVIHEGQKRSVCNWAGSDAPTLSGDGFYRQSVPRSEIQNVRSLAEFCHRFRFGFSFYMQNWHSIDVNKKLYPLN